MTDKPTTTGLPVESWVDWDVEILVYVSRDGRHVPHTMRVWVLAKTAADAAWLVGEKIQRLVNDDV